MAWSTTRKAFGVCGNFRYEIVSLTDVKATRSLVKPTTMNQIFHVATTNTSDNTDVLAGQTLNWTGTADSDTSNEIVDSSETFDPVIDGAQAHNTTDGRTSYVTYKDADELYCHKGGYDRSPATGDATYDLCPDGNEEYIIKSERVAQVVAGTADDEGTVLILGR